MTLRFLTPALAALALASTPLLQASEGPLLGFGPESSAAQRALEARFTAALSASDQDQWLKTLSAEPHHVGSAAGLAWPMSCRLRIVVAAENYKIHG